MDDQTKQPEGRLRLVISIPRDRWAVETIKAATAAATAANGGALPSGRWLASRAFVKWYYATCVRVVCEHAPGPMSCDIPSPPSSAETMAAIPLEIDYEDDCDNLALVADLNL
jgi:hypothetical protein